MTVNGSPAPRYALNQVATRRRGLAALDRSNEKRQTPLN